MNRHLLPDESRAEPVQGQHGVKARSTAPVGMGCRMPVPRNQTT